MAHFAELDENNLVLRVLVVNNEDILDENGNESEAVGVQFLKDLCGADTKWVQSSYNGNIRYNPAGIGYTYDEDNDAFIEPRPFASWSLDANFQWQAPVPHPSTVDPSDTALYLWDELYRRWVAVDQV